MQRWNILPLNINYQLYALSIWGLEQDDPCWGGRGVREGVEATPSRKEKEAAGRKEVRWWVSSKEMKVQTVLMVAGYNNSQLLFTLNLP
jgi:hypothetical protein